METISGTSLWEQIMTPVPSVSSRPAGLPGASTAPPLCTNMPGRSLTSFFPDVKPALVLAIPKHKLNPGQLYKIDPQLKDRPMDSHLQLSEAGIFIKAERDESPKEYPSFRYLHNPIHIYFNVLMHQLITSRSQASLIDFTHSSSKYISGLYKLYLKYEWPQGLE